jgi:hypothetical protein
MLLDERFDDACLVERGWYDNTGVTITSAGSAGAGAAAEFHFDRGATTPRSGGAIRHLFDPTDAVYLRYRVKYSPNWVGSGREYHPHEVMLMGTRDGEWDGASETWLTLYVEQNYEDGGRPRLAIQDSKAINQLLGALPLALVGLTEDRSVGGCNAPPEAGLVAECYNGPPWFNNKQLRGPVAFRPTPGPGYKGDWNTVEAFFRLNSVRDGAAVPDGVMQYWFNGQLLLDRHDITFRTAPRADERLRQLLIAPYIGDGSPVAQTMWMDDLLVASQRMPPGA